MPRSSSTLAILVVLPPDCRAWMRRLCERLAEHEKIDVGVQVGSVRPTRSAPSRAALATLDRVDGALFGGRPDRADRTVPAPTGLLKAEPDVVIDLAGCGQDSDADRWTLYRPDNCAAVAGESVVPIALHSAAVRSWAEAGYVSMSTPLSEPGHTPPGLWSNWLSGSQERSRTAPNQASSIGWYLSGEAT